MVTCLTNHTLIQRPCGVPSLPDEQKPDVEGESHAFIQGDDWPELPLHEAVLATNLGKALLIIPQALKALKHGPWMTFQIPRRFRLSCGPLSP